jgi:hypothetical protein
LRPSLAWSRNGSHVISISYLDLVPNFSLRCNIKVLTWSSSPEGHSVIVKGLVRWQVLYPLTPPTSRGRFNRCPPSAAASSKRDCRQHPAYLFDSNYQAWKQPHRTTIVAQPSFPSLASHSSSTIDFDANYPDYKRIRPRRPDTTTKTLTKAKRHRVVCVLLCVGLCRLHVVLFKMSNLPDLNKRCYLSHEGGD